MPKNNSNSWYATKKLMAAIEAFGKVYYCPLKTNRLVDDSGGDEPYKRIAQLNWNATEVQRGKLIKVRGFPRIQEGEIVPRHCLYRQDRRRSVSGSAEYVVTNDLTQGSTDDTQKVCAVRSSD